VKARASGYRNGSCTKEITGTGDFWCSIALEVGEDADTALDTGDGPVAGVAGDDLEQKSCGCSHGGAAGGVGFGLMILFLGGSFWRRSV
jgi:MYXO-CTERM domain-containing protein